jgi:hypothetical protein
LKTADTSPLKWHLVKATLFSQLFGLAIGIALGLVFSLDLVLVTCLPSWAAPANKEVKKETFHKGWMVFQESSNGGPINCTITDQAIRMDIASCRFSAIAKAPDWNICVLRPDTKEMGFVKLSQWQRFNTNTVGATDECTLEKPIAKKAIKLRGVNVPAYQYTFPGEKVTTAIFQTEKPREVSNYFVDSYQLSTAPQVAAIQCQLYNCIKLDGLLINCIGKITETNEPHWFIRTKRVVRNESIPASTFELPKNYKTLKTIDSSFKFKDMSSSIDDFGEMLNIGKERPAKPK